jgi:hypothetical protein
MSIRRLSLTALSLAAALAACGDDTSAPAGADATTGADATAGSDTATGADTVAGSDAATGSDTATGADTTPGEDPLCDDGAWDEALPNDTADIAGFIADYGNLGHRAFVDAVLEARYPVGAHLVEDGVRLGSRLGDCIDIFIGNTGSASNVIGRLSTIVHECGHFLDVSEGGFSSSYFRILDDLDFSCPRVGNNLARSLMNDDEYSDLLPSDSYKPVYLDGDPTNAQFEGGDQGYDSVLEETTQYVNSLATDWALRDQIGAGRSISARDGILTFLWYTMRYLRMARLDDPTTYNAIIGNACWREATLTVWNRAWFFLDLSESIRSLGINDARLMELVGDPNLRGEIDAIRDAHGCPAR